jgi:HD-GYP domain-containing protein (c-di-GMP phosphodiesterase class II)
VRKPGPLNAREWDLVRRHPELGAEMVFGIPGLEGAAAVVVHHHESYDGSGYPDGLTGEDIPLASRIVAVCDAYHAMVSDRPYRAALRPITALRELQRRAGTQFDPEAVLALTRVARVSL